MPKRENAEPSENAEPNDDVILAIARFVVEKRVQDKKETKQAEPEDEEPANDDDPDTLPSKGSATGRGWRGRTASGGTRR